MMSIPSLSRRVRISLVLAAAVVLAACASPTHRAPVEDRSVKGRSAPAGAVVATPAPSASPTPTAPEATVAAPAAAPAVKPPPPGIENLGKPGYYAVKPGDTMIRIGLETGQNWKDIVRWNNLENPNLIEVGQVLRVVPPGVDPSAATTRPVAPVPSAVPAPAPAVAAGAVPPAVAGPNRGAPAASAAAGAPPSAGAPGPSTTVQAPAAPATLPSSGGSGDDDVSWMWPASGPVLAGFDEARSKGLAIGGRAGDPVVAAADGRVVYAGSGLRGYGNLVIVKHNNTFLTAYAHNQALLVREDQVVKRGQRIAEMGSTDADRVQLHFEIRRQGRPIDPSRLLPSR
jgi:lipoprotein NlpD